jgi:hypothetical protein
VDPVHIIETLRVLLVIGFSLTAVLAYVLLRGDADRGWHRRYFEEHPGVRHDFDAWRRRRRRELTLSAGRCPDHELELDPRGVCAKCHRYPDP